MHGLILVIVRLLLRKFTQVFVNLVDQLVLSLKWINLRRLENLLIAFVHEGIRIRPIWVCRGHRPPVSAREVSGLERRRLVRLLREADLVLLMLPRVQMVPEQWLLPGDTRRANLAMSAFRILLVVPEDSIRHVLL